MNAAEFHVHLRKLNSKDDVLIYGSDIQGAYAKYDIDIVEASRSALSSLIGCVSRTGDTITITKAEEVYTRGDRVVWSYPYEEVTRHLAAIEKRTEEYIQQYLEDRLLFYTLGFENLLRLDKVISQHITLVIEEGKIVCKFEQGDHTP